MKTISLFKTLVGLGVAILLPVSVIQSKAADLSGREDSKGAHYVYIAGQVTIPSRYPYTNGLTVGTAIKMARGVTDEAAATKVTLTREGEKPTALDLKAIQHGQAKDVELQPGDRVYVPKK